MTKKRIPTLKFNKNNTVEDNMKVFKQYISKLDKDFGKILNAHVDDSFSEIRSNIKNDVFDLIITNE